MTELTSTLMSIVLVHGGFVDGSGWESVYSILKKDGYTVSVVQNPTISLAGDVAATRSIVRAQEGPVILVGHSYGGAVITEAGNDARVAGLVYIAAFAPDKGESVAKLIKDPGLRSDGARRAIPEGEIERRGGRDRSERKGGPPLAGVRGELRHSRPRRHGHAHRAA